MGKRYIVALSRVPVDISIKKEALVTPCGSPPPPAISQVVLPRLAQHVAENHAEFELIHGSSEKDFEGKKDLIKQVKKQQDFMGWLLRGLHLACWCIKPISFCTYTHCALHVLLFSRVCWKPYI